MGPLDEYGKMLDLMQTRIRAEILKGVTNKPDFEVVVAYSAYTTDDKDVPIDNLDCIAAKGRIKFVAKVSPFWHNFGKNPNPKHGGKNYESPVVENPTWLDVAILADDMIRTVGDFHHVFLEKISHRGEKDGIQIYGFLMGS